MRNVLVIALVSWAVAGSGFVAAASFDGKQSLVCTTTELYECDPARGCRLVDPVDAGDVRHIHVDFRNKVVKLHPDETAHASRIDRVETVDGKLVIQGIEDGTEDAVDGGGWTLSIDNRYGSMVFTVAGGSMSFSGFGGCAAAQ
ncbi:MAG: hypothetical protein E2O75_05690 [Chloroflexi bacterium]|nr:MAG: hypothetical protein E2O75_05690 [Chloroflexota bacterium]